MIPGIAVNVVNSYAAAWNFIKQRNLVKRRLPLKRFRWVLSKVCSCQRMESLNSKDIASAKLDLSLYQQGQFGHLQLSARQILNQRTERSTINTRLPTVTLSSTSTRRRLYQLPPQFCKSCLKAHHPVAINKKTVQPSGVPNVPLLPCSSVSAPSTHPLPSVKSKDFSSWPHLQSPWSSAWHLPSWLHSKQQSIRQLANFGFQQNEFHRC